MKIAHGTIIAITALGLGGCGGGGDGGNEGKSLPAAGVIERFEIVSTADTYGGASFGSAGSYQVITGIVHGKLHPAHPANAGIVDLGLAPVSADGYVGYTADVVILRPRNAATAKRVLFYDAPNRGIKVAALVFNAAGPTFAAGQQGNAERHLPEDRACRWQLRILG